MSVWTAEDVAKHNARIGAKMPTHVPAIGKKFGNKKTLSDGIVFDSGHEANRYRELKLLMQSGEITDLELQPLYEIFACEMATGRGIHVASFKADFRYFDVKRGRQRIEDAKSDGTKGETAYRLRKRLVEACWGVEIEEV